MESTKSDDASSVVIVTPAEPETEVEETTTEETKTETSKGKLVILEYMYIGVED